MPIFNSIHELLRRIGVASNDVPDVGLFHEAFGGRWQHVCHVDFPFQKDIELVFQMNKATPEIPKTMTGNVAWIQDHLPEIWNAAAKAINEIASAQNIELHDELEVEPLEVQLPDQQLPDATWRFTIEPVGLNAAFRLTFRGLSVIGTRYE
jgi:hypothetical protein